MDPFITKVLSEFISNQHASVPNCLMSAYNEYKLPRVELTLHTKETKKHILNQTIGLKSLVNMLSYIHAPLALVIRENTTIY